MKLDILAIGVHPDDVELSATGTLIKSVAQGKKVGILDLTQGELGTRGNAELRLKEAASSAKIQGIHVRENLGMADGFFTNDEAHQRKVIEIIRKYKPDVVLSNAPSDRHPDHGRACKLVSDACFYSGLRKVLTFDNGNPQEVWRPNAIYNYIQDRYLEPDFVVDITPYVDQKLKAIMAFSSQFFNPDSTEPTSPISSENFIHHIKGRWSNFGRLINVDYAEGFISERPFGVDDLLSLK
jgi:bacillithiol biosynthesis deacetylase BshB1